MTLFRSKEKSNREYKAYLQKETILCLLDRKFIGDDEANRLVARPRRQGYELPPVG